MPRGSSHTVPADSGARPVPKRIALFTGAYNHIADGVSLTLNRLVDYLERHGTAVRVFAPTVDDPPIRHAGLMTPVPSIAFPGRSEYRLALSLPPAVRAQIAAFKPTLFHIATPDPVGAQALRLGRSWGLPVVSSYHTHFSSYMKYYPGFAWTEHLIWPIVRWFYNRCREVYVPAPSLIPVLRAHGITTPTRLWQRGVETERFAPEHRSPAWRRSLGVADDEVLIGFVSRLVWEKGLDVFAEVVEGLKARGVPHRSVIVGTGPIQDALAERLPDTIFTGHLAGDDLSRAYASCDLFLFPSETETFGNVTLEAMASGLPTVCADAAGSNVLVEHGETGFLAPARDGEAFLAYVEQLIRDDDLRRRMSRAARERALTFRWEEILARMDAYYDLILNPDGPPPASDAAPLGPRTARPSEPRTPLLLQPS